MENVTDCPNECPDYVKERLTKCKSSNPSVPAIAPKPQPPMYLASLHPHALDVRIIDQDEPHRYFIDGSCENVISVTEFVHAFFPDFDCEKESQKTCETKTFRTTAHRPSNKYYGCATAADIRERWDLWQKQGTALHKMIENHFNNVPNVYVDEDNVKPWTHFLSVMSPELMGKWTPFRTEWAIFDPIRRIAGKIDYVGYCRETNQFAILDWKRSGHISDKSNGEWQGAPRQFGYGPCRDLCNCNFITYALQLGTYASMLSEFYGIVISRCYLIQMHPSLKSANVVEVPQLGSVIQEMKRVRSLVMGGQ